MNNEPVAWLWNEDECNLGVVLDQDKKMGNEFNDYTIPLYTHPTKPSMCIGYWDNKTGAFHKELNEIQQKRVDAGFLQPVYIASMFLVKTLTDEEIMECWAERDQYANSDYRFNFARAILRKAQEK